MSEQSPTLVLYGHPDSGHALKVALALALAGWAARTVWVDIWADPDSRPQEFLAASPFAEVPLLLIDGVPHVQSGAILLEIAARFKCLGGEHPDGLRRAFRPRRAWNDGLAACGHCRRTGHRP
jgi:glutathione S-transferase